MTFSASQYTLVEPSGLARFSNSSSMASFATDDKIPMADTETLVGSSVASIAAGVITLPVGYYYLLEGALDIGRNGGVAGANTRQIYTQFYDENATSYIGTQSYQNGEKANNFEDIVLLSRDETARVWIDATASAASVSWRIQTVASSAYNASDVLYSKTNPERWVGYTRCLVWRFD